MAEFDDKLNSLLSDPDSMAKIMQLAQSLSGGDSAASPQQQAPPPPQQTPPPAPASGGGGNPLSALTGGLDPAMIARLLPLVQELNRDDGGASRQLLYALRPYLRQDRQGKVERALQLARLIHIGKKFLSSWEGFGGV